MRVASAALAPRQPIRHLCGRPRGAAAGRCSLCSAYPVIRKTVLIKMGDFPDCIQEVMGRILRPARGSWESKVRRG